MRRILLATAALAFGAGTAMAAGPDAEIAISADNPAECHITTYDALVDLTGVAVDSYVEPNFEYQCNFVGSPTLTFTSTNLGLQNGAYNSDYGIYLNDLAISGSPSGWQQASDTPAPYTGITTTVTPNVPVSPNFALGLSEALEVAGLYQDTLTISILP